MEMIAVIEALSRLKYPCKVIVRTDSQYVVNGITKGWAAKWQKNNWIKSDKQPALNPDLWEKLLTLCETHEVEFEWIRGHAGHIENERCDALAVKACERFKE
jgi:ribonuclease HI